MKLINKPNSWFSENMKTKNEPLRILVTQKIKKKYTPLDYHTIFTYVKGI